MISIPRCTKCGLHKHAKTVLVESRGSDSPIVLFVGEGPGRTEDRVGRASVGDAGRKNDEMLEAAKFDPAWGRWTNTVRCLSLKDWKSPRMGTRPPTEEETAGCRGYLEAEILRTNPTFIVPMGLTAIQWFLPSAKAVGSARGRRYQVEIPTVAYRFAKAKKWAEVNNKELTGVEKARTENQMRKVIEDAEKAGLPHADVKPFTVWPTYHPSAVLRSGKEKGASEGNMYEQSIIEDFSFIRQQITGESTVPWGDYHMLGSLDKIRDEYEEIKRLYRAGKIKHIVIDLETTALNPFLCPYADILLWAISYGDRTFCVPFNHMESPFWSDSIALQAIIGMTNDLFAEVPIANHNVKFDANWLCYFKMIVRKVVGDTYLASWTLFNDTTVHDLETLVTRYTGMINHKEEMNSAMDRLPRFMPLEQRWTDKLDPLIVDGRKPPPDGSAIKWDKKMQKLYRPRNMGDLPIDLVSRYCCADAHGGFLLQDVMNDMLEKAKLLEPHNRVVISAILPTVRMEQAGIKIDMEMMHAAQETLQHNLDEQFRWFEEKGYIEEVKSIIEANPEKYGKLPKIVKIGAVRTKRILLYDILKIKVTKRTGQKGRRRGAPAKPGQKSAPSTDKEVLKTSRDAAFEIVNDEEAVSKAKKRAAEQIEVLDRIIAANKDSKILSSYVRPIPDHTDANHVGHPGFGICTTESGRFNNRDHPLVHSIPRRSIVKKGFVPHDHLGLILGADYSQMELRIMANYCRDEQMLAAFAEGKDIHRFVASISLNKPEDEVTKVERSYLKAVSFGVCFDRSAPSIAAQLGISTKEAEKIVKKFYKAFPRIAEWADTQRVLVKKHMEIWNAWGFRRVFAEGQFEPDELERRAINTPIQGTAAHVTNTALANISNALERFNYKSSIWATIHDSIDFSIRRGELYRMMKLVRSLMEDWPAKHLSWLDVPLKADFEAGVNWGDTVDCSIVGDGQVEMKGKWENFAKLKLVLLSWSPTPRIVKIERFMENDDDGKPVAMAKCIWEFPEELAA